MNYYEHHIGDYAEATAHLTFIEDATYSRLIRKYYATEKPLPIEIKSVQRLINARSKEEKNAVVSVLNEFFTLTDEGNMQPIWSWACVRKGKISDWSYSCWTDYQAGGRVTQGENSFDDL